MNFIYFEALVERLTEFHECLQECFVNRTLFWLGYTLLQLTALTIIDAFISIIIKGTITIVIKETEHKKEGKGRRRGRKMKPSMSIQNSEII